MNNLNKLFNPFRIAMNDIKQENHRQKGVAILVFEIIVLIYM